MGMINDIGIEGDGDIVFATTDGALLFTAYGFLKRTLSGDAFPGSPLPTRALPRQDAESLF